MAKILLDYFFKIIALNPTPAASTAFLKQVCVLVLPKDGGVTTGVITECTTSTQIAALTNNAEAARLLDAGLSRVFILPVDDLDVADAMDANQNEFFTVLISSDFDSDDIESTQAQGVFTVSSYANLVSGTADTVSVAGVAFTAQAGAATPGAATFQAATSNNATAASLATQINEHATTKALVVATVDGAVVTVKAKNAGSAGNDIAAAYADNDTNVGGAWTGLSAGKLSGGDGLFLGTFDGVVGAVTDDADFNADWAATENRCAFPLHATHLGKNMFYAFGKLLSNPTDWKNQQYIAMPYDGDATVLGDAESFFDDKISFVITDDEFSHRLALFAAGGKAIVAPYIIRNLEIDLQSKGLQYVSANQPAYSLTQAALLEDELQKVIDGDGQENGNPGYVGKGWITEGSVSVTLEQDDFVASSRIAVPTPRALWRIAGQITQS